MGPQSWKRGMGSGQVAGTVASWVAAPAPSSHPGGSPGSSRALGGERRMPGRRAGPATPQPPGSPRPFGLNRAEVKPEPRLGAGLAPALDGPGLRLHPLLLHPGRLLEEEGRGSRAAGAGEVATESETEDQAAVGPRRPRLILLPPSPILRDRDGAHSPGSRSALSAPAGSYAAPRAPPGTGGRGAAAPAASDRIPPVRRGLGV